MYWLSQTQFSIYITKIFYLKGFNTECTLALNARHTVHSNVIALPVSCSILGIFIENLKLGILIDNYKNEWEHWYEID